MFPLLNSLLYLNSGEVFLSTEMYMRTFGNILMLNSGYIQLRIILSS